MTRFDLLYACGLPMLLPYLLWRRLTRGKYTESAAGMLGRKLPDARAARRFADGSLWLHAVSYGEVNAARAAVPYLGEISNLHARPLVVSTVTETGQAHARKSFPDAAVVTYFPADFSCNVRRFQKIFNPHVFILMETELWPNFLMLARRRGTLCFMLNAKLSDRSFPRYRFCRRLLEPGLHALRGICAQTELDAERFIALGIPASRVKVTGNCKFDLAVEPLTKTEKSDWLRRLGLDSQRRWIIAGSTHPGEEELMIPILRQLRRTGIDAGLIICPRHPERFDDVYRLCSRSEFPTSRASSIGSVESVPLCSQPATRIPQSESVILILDQMGVLARAYGLGEIAIVAGSFCRVGGHNLLEAAAHRIPVLFGPHMHSQREIARLFQQAGAGLQIAADQLASMCQKLLSDSAFCSEHADLAYGVVERNRGSAARAAAYIANWLAEEQCV